MPGTGVETSKQNSGARLLPAGLFAHTEQDFRGQIKPVLSWTPAAGVRAQSTGQPSPTSAGETH